MTHWINYDEPRIGRYQQRALCGALVNRTAHANAPTCPDCAEVLREDEATLDATLASLEAIPSTPASRVGLVPEHDDTRYLDED